MAKKTTAVTSEQSDFGTAELKQHHTIITEQGEDNTKRARNITQTPLDWYKARSYISEEEWEAGNRIYQDFVYAGRIQLTVSDFSKLPYRSKPPHDFSDGQIAARKRFYKALDQLEQEGQKLVLHICCFSEWTHHQSLPERYAFLRLRSALRELARYYGLNAQTAVPIRKGEK